MYRDRVLRPPGLPARWRGPAARLRRKPIRTWAGSSSWCSMTLVSVDSRPCRQRRAPLPPREARMPRRGPLRRYRSRRRRPPAGHPTPRGRRCGRRCWGRAERPRRGSVPPVNRRWRRRGCRTALEPRQAAGRRARHDAVERTDGSRGARDRGQPAHLGHDRRDGTESALIDVDHSQVRVAAGQGDGFRGPQRHRRHPTAFDVPRPGAGTTSLHLKAAVAVGEPG